LGRRVVITAMGVISPLGSETAIILEALRRGQVVFRLNPDTGPGTGAIFTAPVEGFDPKAHTGRFKNARYLSRGAALASAAALVAVKKAGLGATQWARTGLFIGAGPNLDLGGEFPEIRRGAMDRPDLAALWMLRFLPNTAAAAISQLAGIHGENTTIASACTASLQAVGEAFRRVRDGYLERALAGGGDSRLSPGALLAYRKARALWTGMGDAGAQYAPFDLGRSGFVPGEGAAFFLLETVTAARSRGATILGEVCGYGAALDAHAMTAPDPSGRWAEAAVRGALTDAQMFTDEVDTVSAHGTGTPLNDAMEGALLERVFANSPPRVTAFKSWTGHLASACGAVELALGLICLGAGLIPPVRNLKKPCHPRLNFVRALTVAPIHTLLLENFGFGGQNAALVVRRWAP
jgi:3-oxoacyl-[acyl-carrier-protein] synthase II